MSSALRAYSEADCPADFQALEKAVPLLRRVDGLDQLIVRILDPLCTKRRFCIDDRDDLVERQVAGLMFRQQGVFFSSLGLAAALEGIPADSLRAGDHGFRSLAERLAQLLDGLLVRGRQVEHHACVAQQDTAGGLTVHSIKST